MLILDYDDSDNFGDSVEFRKDYDFIECDDFIKGIVILE